MRHLHFIINKLSPIANKVEKEVLAHFKAEDVVVIVKMSKYSGHAVELTMASISEGAHTIVACGGDGTVNEVAQCLVGTAVPLGILPIGSGNGLARNLCIPTNLSSALEVLKTFENKKIDVGTVNDRYFFCNISVAFSAQVIHCYDNIHQRGLIAYSRAFFKAVSSFNYKSFELQEDRHIVKSTPFILLISNTDQLGYNRTLTPDASLLDGKLDMIRIERSNVFLLAFFLLFALFSKFPPFLKVHRKQLDDITLLCPDELLKIQIDGEKLEWKVTALKIGLLPKSLNVIY